MLKKLKKILAFGLVLVTSTSNVYAYTSGTNGTGPGGSGGMDSLGFAIEIKSEKDDYGTKTPSHYLQKKYLENAANKMRKQNVEQSLLIKVKDKQSVQGTNTYVEQGKDIANFKYVQVVNKDSSGELKEFIFQDLVKAFENDLQLTWEEYVAARDAGKSRDTHKSFVTIFGKPEETAKKLMDYLDTKGTWGKDRGFPGYERLAYLDVLSMVNKMCGYIYDNQIRTFLETYNNADSKQWVFIQVSSLGSMLPSGGKQYWYTPQGFYGEMFNNGVDAYSKTPSNRPHYPSNEDDFEWADIKEYERIVAGRSAKSGYTRNVGLWGTWALGSRGTIWNTGNKFDFKYTAMPTSYDGKQIGNSGYTFLTTKFNTPDMRIGKGLPNFEIYIKSDPKGEQVPESGNATSTVEFRVNFIDDMAIDAMKEFLDFYPKYTVEITINFYTRILEGSANQGKLIDSIEGLPADARIEGTPDKPKIIIPVTKANIDGILSGIPFRFKDDLTNMSKDGVVIKYAADSQMKVDTHDPKASYNDKIAWAIGVEKEKAVVYDTTNWIPNPKEYKYISNLKESYVEIKEGSPGNEEFEAMAGVPTTRDLYVGFGAQEFEVQVEAGYEKEAASRTVKVVATGESTGEGLPCPSAGIPCPKHPKYNDKGELTGYETHGSDACGGATCLSHPSYNIHHPGGYTATYTTTIPIDEYGYMDVKAAQGWHIDNAKLYGNPELFSNPNQTIDPDLRYTYMVSEEGYSSGNGRLGFKFNFEQGPSWGDITETHDLGTSTTKSLNSAVNGIFNSHKGFTDEVTVFSDAVVLETSQGVQSVLYDSYKSRTVTDAGGTGYTGQALNFGNSGGSVSYGVKEGSAKFDKIPTADEIWNNKWSAGRLDPDDMVTSGYNGNFGKPNNKWDHRKYPISGDPLDKFYWKDYGHPNAVQTFKDARPPKLGFKNKDLTYEGLDIIDSTDENRNWSASDNLEPVYNGEWDTGETEINYVNFMNFKITTGRQYGPAFKRTPIYSDDHYEVNDIVVHNPVSAQQATVISNPEVWDMRTEESLAAGGDPSGPPPGFCPGEGSCTLSHLNCTTPFVPHSASCYKTAQGGVVHKGGNNTHVHDSNCVQGGKTDWINKDLYYSVSGTDYHSFTAIGDGSVRFYSTGADEDPRGRIYVNGSLVVDNDDGGDNLNFDTGSVRFNKGDNIRANVYAYNSRRDGYIYGHLGITYDNTCTGALNTHVCTSECKPQEYSTLVCTEPHHYEAGKPYNPLDPKYHHPLPDSRCWDPCLDDDRHNQKVDIIINGKPAKPGDLFINLDKPFQIYYPDIGNFEQNPNLHGISETTETRGMGYVDNMDTKEWLRDKYVTFPVNVIDELGNPHPAGTPIDLLELPSSGDIYNFHCVLGNSEYSNATVTYLSIGNNAREEDYYDESIGVTNRDRPAYKYGAMHTASKDQYIDVVGFIGNLTINDTGDFRFASLFKKPLNNGKWLIDNLVPEVDVKSPNFIVADDTNILQDKATANNKYHSPYDVTNAVTGGKAHQYVSLPLTPKDNPIPALRNKPLRPGYNLFMDVETIGNYYGENFAEVNGSDTFAPVDNDMYYKVQVTPRYFELDLDTKEYKPVDVYMGTDGNYRMIISHNDLDKTTEWLYYLNWLEESARRNYTAKEKETSYDVQSQYGNNILVTGVRLPQNVPDPLGSASRLFLNELDRTFIGSSKTYGQNMNPGNVFPEILFKRQSQRNHFTVGLPSSSVFVHAGEAPTTANIEKISNNNSVIVGTLDIKARGEVWTLEYNGDKVNYSDLPTGTPGDLGPPGVPPNSGGNKDNGGGIQVFPGGPIYPAPPSIGKVEDPVYIIIDNKYTSRDDLRTEGSH